MRATRGMRTELALCVAAVMVQLHGPCLIVRRQAQPQSWITKSTMKKYEFVVPSPFSAAWRLVKRVTTTNKHVHTGVSECCDGEGRRERVRGEQTRSGRRPLKRARGKEGHVGKETGRE